MYFCRLAEKWCRDDLWIFKFLEVFSHTYCYQLLVIVTVTAVRRIIWRLLKPEFATMVLYYFLTQECLVPADEESLSCSLQVCTCSILTIPLLFINAVLPLLQVHYLMVLSANWAYVKDACRMQKYEDIKSKEEQELHDIHSTRSKERLNAYT